jgi:periplasmic divalent cation tolerance protein
MVPALRRFPGSVHLEGLKANDDVPEFSGDNSFPGRVSTREWVIVQQPAKGGAVAMILVYITLNTMEEGQRLAHLLIERRLTNCVNFHPITCTYLWEGKITTEPEIVALVKSRAEHFDAVAAAVTEVVPYTNFVGQIEVPRVNAAFTAWLTEAVP